MTVTYLHHLQSSGLGFYRILFLWAGSIYKGIWKTLITYCILYSTVTFVYRVILTNYEDAKETFERFCVFANENENNLPLNFILGFYVTQVCGKDVVSCPRSKKSNSTLITISGCESMVEPILVIGLAGHLCHESGLLLPWTRKGLQGRSLFQVPLFLLILRA